jgi:hypothetical protein
MRFQAGPLDISATASDANGVAAVDFFVDDVLVESDSGAPYTTSFVFTTGGEHGVRVVARDACGNTSPSETVRIHIEDSASPCELDQEPPSVTITSPANGATVPRGPLTVTANATDNLGTAHVAFEIDGTIRGDAVDLTAPFSYTFTPARSGQSLRARAEDVCGHVTWSPAVSFQVANTPPAAVADAAETRTGKPVSIPVLANDSDPDGDALSLAANAVIEAPTKGTAVPSGSSVVYTPGAGIPAAGLDSENDTFRYRVTDAYGAVQSATVTVTVRANRKPNAVADSATTRADLPVTIPVLANDWDPDGDAIALTANPIIEAPTKGTASPSGSAIVYTPNPGFPSTGGTETDVFRYRIVDSLGAIRSALVTVTIRLNRPPEAVADSGSTRAGQPIILTVTLNDSDPDGDTVRLATNTPFPEMPSNGTVQRLDDNTVRYAPRLRFAGTDRFRYQITDGHGGVHTAEVTVVVTLD